MSRQKALDRYAAYVGFSSQEKDGISLDDPRARHIERMSSQAVRDQSIVAEVVEAHNCASGYRVGDRFVMDVDGNFITKLCPKKLCVYAVSNLTTPVALINERFSEGLDPNAFHFMHLVSCPDVGVACGGYGQVRMRVRVVPREELPA